ncbi:MAG: TolB family protein [Methanococcaceae archaeon]
MKNVNTLYFRLIFILSIFYSSGTIISSQDTINHSKDPFEPVPYLPGIVSLPGTFGITFMPDGKTVYFARLNPETKKPVIMKSTFREGAWTSPMTAEFSGKYPEGDPFISPDGFKVFFWSTRPTDGSVIQSGSPNIWVAYRTPSCFGNPVCLSSELNIPAGGFPVVSAKGSLYFFTGQGDGTNETDIFKSVPVNGEYTDIENLGTQVNTKYSELDAFISPDESYMIFSSNRPGGFGKLDLYISRNSEGKWSEPVNLGNKINSAANEYCPSVSPDQKYFYFTSERAGETKGPIYMIDFNLLINSLNHVCSMTGEEMTPACLCSFISKN